MTKIVSLVLFGLTIVSASYSMGQDYAAPSYAAPSYEDNYDDVVRFTVLQISVGRTGNYTSQIWRQTGWFIIYFFVWQKQNVHYEYIIKDNYGNEQSKKERIDDSSRDVEWHILQKGGYAAPVHSVPSYSAPSHLAQSYGAPSYSAASYSAPAYSAPSYSAPSYSAPAYQKPTMAP